MTLGIAAANGMNNEFIAPDSSALFDITITNESPYRESQIFGLLLTSGSSYTGYTYGNMKDLNFIIDGNDKISPMGDLFHLHDIPSTDDGSMSGNLVNSVVSLRIDRGANVTRLRKHWFNVNQRMRMDVISRSTLSRTDFAHGVSR